MILINDILNTSGRKFVEEIKAEFDIKGLNDTGSARDSISFNVKGTTLSIDGKLRVVVLQDGRKPGKFPPINVIKSWVKRNLNVDDKEIDGVSFVIARKIAEKGTDIFTNKAKGLQLELIIDRMQQVVFEEINKEVFFQLNNSIFEQLKK